MILFLIGFMGSGKSTVGSRVARRLGYGFLDMDREIEQQEGMSIGEIFAQRGEAAFRDMERRMLESLHSDGDLIIATGGGTPCFGDNLELMKSKGTVVYFKASPETLAVRLRRNQHRRPKLAGLGPEELLRYIGDTLAEREKYYSQAAITIDCNGVGDEYIASHLEHYIVDYFAQQNNPITN